MEIISRIVFDSIEIVCCANEKMPCLVEGSTCDLFFAFVAVFLEFLVNFEEKIRQKLREREFKSHYYRRDTN